MKTIGIYAGRFDIREIEHLKSIIQEIEKHNGRIMIYKDTFKKVSEYLENKEKIEIFENAEQLQSEADFLLSLGGDGTLLSTVSFICNSGIPVLGFNFGRLGFLSNTKTSDIATAIESIFSGSYSISKRSLLKLKTINNQTFEKDLDFALNDISITKKESNYMLLIHTYVNGHKLHSLWADGIIISTPTGSTAYSLSCNGPIVTPDCQNFIITPIAPHNLSVRPVVIPNSSKIKFVVESKNNTFNLTLDSKTHSVKSKSEICIEKENFEINLLNLAQSNFLETIRDKLSWGIDKRN